MSFLFSNICTAQWTPVSEFFPTQVMGVAAITIVLTNYFTHSGWLFWGMRIPGGGGGQDKLVGCQSIEVNSTCHRLPGYSHCPGGARVAGPAAQVDIGGQHEVTASYLAVIVMQTANYRMLNVSGDEVLDIVIGFGTGADG